MIQKYPVAEAAKRLQVSVTEYLRATIKMDHINYNAYVRGCNVSAE